MTIQRTWWKDATIYQIWPASFKDSNGDGVGDIPGIISTLDYIKSLSIDVIWLSPMYESPQDDMGYDISDYESVYPKYGTLDDMDKLISEIHARGMKLILDLVVNHTSDQHLWFQESKSSKENPKRDWYIWRPPRYDEQGNKHPPNNWMSCFSGSAWEYDESTEEYYLHLFASSQPDLNWENEETRQAIYDSALKFWLEKGVDGFRIDIAGSYSKDQSFSDAPVVFPDSEFQPFEPMCLNGPRIHEFHKEMFAKVTSKYDVMTVGEVGECSREDTLKYVSSKEKEMNMMFLFDVIRIGSKETRYEYQDFTLPDFKKAVEKQSSFIGGTDAWSTVFIEDHDEPRSVNRFGNVSNSTYHCKSAKLLALLQTTLTGTLFVYQGQEIGMTNLPESWTIDEYLDIQTVNYYKDFEAKYGNDKAKMKDLMDKIRLLAMEHARSPVQWDASYNGGFSTGKPWMRVNDNYKSINVASQVNEPNSILSFWKRSLEIRKKYKDVFIYGSYKTLDLANTKTFTYIKDSNGKKAYIVLNFSDEQVKFEKLVDNELELIHSNAQNVNEVILTPYEGRIYLLK